MSAETWQQSLKHAYTSLAALRDEGLLTDAEYATLAAQPSAFQLRIPRAYAALIDRNNLGQCPIRKQALPSLLESDPVLPAWAKAWSQRAYGTIAPWRADAIGDLGKLASPRLTHRYGNRALLHLTPTCAMYCRFCFRKAHLSAKEEQLYHGSLDEALAYLSAEQSVTEVILSGGDPLSYPDRTLAALLAQLAQIPHLQILRIHSRMLATLPNRLTPALVAALSATRLRVVLVNHFNHPRELTEGAHEALQLVARSPLSSYNQTVLLRGINDNADVLGELFWTLYALGCSPYYLHHPDWTPHTFGFRLSIAQGRALYAELLGRLSGPSLPHYVLDIPGGHGKISLMDGRIALQAQQEGEGIVGALYEIPHPHTRAVQDKEERHSSLYVDLSYAP